MPTAILKHPAFYNGPRMVKPPIVLVAGMLRPRAAASTRRLGVLGDGRPAPLPAAERGRLGRVALARHATFRGRWWLANYPLERSTKDPDDDAGTEPLNAAKLVDRAAAFWGSPTLTRPTRNALTTFARRVATADASWKEETYLVLIQNALRQPGCDLADYQDLLMAILPLRLLAIPSPQASRGGGGRGLPAVEAGMPLPRRNRPRPARLPRPLGRSLPLRLRRVEARLPSPRGGRRCGGLEPAGPRARVGLPRGWRRLA